MTFICSSVWITHSFSLSVTIQQGFLKIHHFKWTWSWNRTAGNPFLRHNRSRKVILPVRPFSFRAVIEQPFLNSHVSHVLHDHKVSHKATQNNYVLLFQLSFFIYSVKVSILPTLFSGQVKSWAACEAKGLNSKWTFIARSCALFFHPLTSCSVLCHVNV